MKVAVDKCIADGTNLIFKKCIICSESIILFNFILGNGADGNECKKTEVFGKCVINNSEMQKIAKKDEQMGSLNIQM